MRVSPLLLTAAVLYTTAAFSSETQCEFVHGSTRRAVRTRSPVGSPRRSPRLSRQGSAPSAPQMRRQRSVSPTGRGGIHAHLGDMAGVVEDEGVNSNFADRTLAIGHRSSGLISGAFANAKRFAERTVTPENIQNAWTSSFGFCLVHVLPALLFHFMLTSRSLNMFRPEAVHAPVYDPDRLWEIVSGGNVSAYDETQRNVLEEMLGDRLALKETVHNFFNVSLVENATNASLTENNTVTTPNVTDSNIDATTSASAGVNSTAMPGSTCDGISNTTGTCTQSELLFAQAQQFVFSFIVAFKYSRKILRFLPALTIMSAHFLPGVNYLYRKGSNLFAQYIVKPVVMLSSFLVFGLLFIAVLCAAGDREIRYFTGGIWDHQSHWHTDRRLMHNGTARALANTARAGALANDFIKQELEIEDQDEADEAQRKAVATTNKLKDIMTRERGVVSTAARMLQNTRNRLVASVTVENENSDNSTPEDSEITCAICQCGITDGSGPFTLSRHCAGAWHEECFENWAKSLGRRGERLRCPSCNTGLSGVSVPTNIRNLEISSDNTNAAAQNQLIALPDRPGRTHVTDELFIRNINPEDHGGVNNAIHDAYSALNREMVSVQKRDEFKGVWVSEMFTVSCFWLFLSLAAGAVTGEDIMAFFQFMWGFLKVLGYIIYYAAQIAAELADD